MFSLSQFTTMPVFAPYNIDSVPNYCVFTIILKPPSHWILWHQQFELSLISDSSFIHRCLRFLLELPKQKHSPKHLFVLFSPVFLSSFSISLTSKDLTITSWQMISQSESLTPSYHSVCFSNSPYASVLLCSVSNVNKTSFFSLQTSPSFWL